jgi:hypothetical protein
MQGRGDSRNHIIEAKGPGAHNGGQYQKIAEYIPVITKACETVRHCTALSLFLFFFCLLLLSPTVPLLGKSRSLNEETVASRPPRSPLVAFIGGYWLLTARFFSTHLVHCGI